MPGALGTERGVYKAQLTWPRVVSLAWFPTGDGKEGLAKATHWEEVRAKPSPLEGPCNLPKAKAGPWLLPLKAALEGGGLGFSPVCDGGGTITDMDGLAQASGKVAI